MLRRRGGVRATAEVRGVVGTSLLLLLLVLGACVPVESDPIDALSSRVSGISLPQPKGLPATELIDQNGARFDLRAAGRGKITFLFFGYTFCPDICPIVVSTLARALQQLEPDVRSEVLAVFVSLDPPRDTPERIGEWLAGIDPTIVGLTGTLDELDAALGELGYVRPPTEIPEEGFYEVAHPGTLFMFTPDRLARFGYQPDDVRADAIAADIGEVLATEWKARARVRVSNARIGDPLGQDRASVYATLENAGDAPDTLTGLGSAGAETGSLHLMTQVEGVMRMGPLEHLVIPPRSTVELAPGRLHGMLEGLGTSFEAGDSVRVTFTFTNAGATTLSVPVLAPADLR